jgi:CDP-diacylglycerol---serine O-phosphatidyltransferase
MGVALIYWLTPFYSDFWQLTTILIFTLICLTDFVDGWIARRLNIVSDLGKILDPLADKILILVFLPLLEMRVISSFPVFIILSREFAIMGLRVVQAQNSDNVAAKISGKIKTALTFPLCGILLARTPVISTPLPAFLEPLDAIAIWIRSWPNWVLISLIWITVAVTIWSFLDYFGQYLWQQYVKKMGGEAAAKKSVRAIIPNTFTLLNLGCGSLAVVFAFFGIYHTAVLLVILGILFDALDGSLARKLDAQSPLGAALDSKADAVSFGIAPAMVVYKSISEYNFPNATAWGICLGILYFAAVMYRLNRFDKQGHSNYFDGLPSPAGACLVLLGAISIPLSQPQLFLPIVLGTALLMASKIPYAHFEIAGRETFLRYFRIPAGIFLLLTLLHLANVRILHQLWAYEVFFALVGLYVLTPVIQWAKQRP